MARDRKKHVCEQEAPAPVPSAACLLSASALASNLPPPHPLLLQLVRLLARQSAEEDIAAQRAFAQTLIARGD